MRGGFGRPAPNRQPCYHVDMRCAYPGCEAEFTPRKGGRPQRFCSPEHAGSGRKIKYWQDNRVRILAERKAKREDERKPLPERTCAWEGCGKTFVPASRGNQLYCSPHCQTKRYRSTDAYKLRATAAQRRRELRPERQLYMRTYRRRGMTDAEFVAMFQAQNGQCAICGERPDELVLDHCHERGANRALLCRYCNLGLGHFRDNPAILEAALRYLASHT